MKILSVTTSLLGNDAASWRIWNIARLLQARGHEVHLVQYVRKSTYERLKSNRLDLGNIPNSIVMVPIFPISIPVAQLKHLRELSQDNYDLVYGNTSSGAFYALLGRVKRIPLIFDMHGGRIEEFLLNNQSNSRWKYSPKLLQFVLDNIIYFVALHFSSKIACVSRRMIQYLHSEKKIPLEKMTYITNGVDLDFFKPVNERSIQILRKQLGLGDRFTFGYIGNFQKWQGVENFIEAARKLDDSGLAFIIIGGEKESEEGNILFIPKIPRSQIPDYYSICDVLVLPRPSHPATEIAAPTKFAEYTAMGKPVLTTNVGDAADLVRKYECGIVVESNNSDDLLQGILEFRSKSKGELAKMGENSRKLAENEFDWNRVAKGLVNMVEETAKQAKII
jgi:glycosyltransferase involved in cell wall biosynthesis